MEIDMTTTRRNLLTLLTFVQNNLKTPIDIMTFTGFMDDAEVVTHTMYYARKIPADKQATLLNMARGL